MNDKSDILESCKKLCDFLAQTREESNDREIEVNIGEIKFGKAPDVLLTRNLGSCLGVTIYDPQLKIGSLLHIKLPDSKQTLLTLHNIDTESQKKEILTSYADIAIPIALYELLEQGSLFKRMVVKIVGGSKMFQVSSGSRLDVGKNNILVTREIFSRYGIPIAAEDTKGDYARTVRFFTLTGLVKVTSENGVRLL